MIDIIKELGLTVFTSEALIKGTRVVSVVEIESKINKLPVVYCSNPDKANSHLWNHYETKGYDTHKARLLGVETIVREPLRREYETIMNTKTHLDWAEFVGKRVKVVVTEIQEGE